MKKILTLLITLGLVSSAFAADFTSYQLASTTLTNGYILQTNGKNNKWVATSSLGFPTGGSGTVTSVSALTPTGLTVSSTTCTTNCILNFTLTSGYVIPLSASTTQWNTFYNASNTLVTFNYASSTFPSFTYSSSTHPSFGYGSSTYYFASNPSGYITSSALTPYVTLSYGSSTYLPLASSSLFYLASNPSGYVTNSVSNLTNYPTYTYASATYALASQIANFLTYAYASSTYASTSWVTATFVPFSYGSSTYVAVTGNQTIGGNKSFTGTTNLTNWTGSNGTSSVFDVTSILHMNNAQIADSANATGTYGQYLMSTGTTTLWSTISGYMTNAYASSTFPSFSYASSTFAPTANPTFTGTINFTNASGTGITATHYGDFYPVGLSNSFIAVDVTGKIIATTTPAGGSISGGQTGYLTRWLSPTTVGTSTLLDDGVNAGVNATSSLYEFYVKGDTVGSHHPFAVASTSGAINFHVGLNGSVGIGTSTFLTGNQQETLKADCGTTTENCIVGYGNINDFLQSVITNSNTGINAKAGFTAQNASSTATSTFAWFGINGSQFATTTAYSVGGKSDVTLIGAGNNLYIANASTTGKIAFLTGGTSTTTKTWLTIDSNGLVYGSSTFFTNASTTNFKVSGMFRDSTNATGTTAMVLKSTGTSTIWVATSSLGITATLSGGTGGSVAYWTSPTALSAGKLKDNGTVAGVNATSSTITFNVSGNGGTTDIFNVASSTGTSTSYLNINYLGKVVLTPSFGQVVIGTTSSPTYGLTVGTTSQFTGGIVQRVVGYASAASTTINVNNTDIATTTIFATTTFVNPVGTYYDGQMFQIAGYATTTRQIFLDTSFGTTTGFTSPITMASGTTYYLFQYSKFRNKWDYMSYQGPFY